MSVRREATNRVTSTCWYQRRCVVWTREGGSVGESSEAVLGKAVSRASGSLLRPGAVGDTAGGAVRETRYIAMRTLRIVTLYGLARRDRERPLNDGQIPNFRVRVHASTGYHRVEGNRRASRNGRVSDPPPCQFDSQLPHRWWETQWGDYGEGGGARPLAGCSCRPSPRQLLV
jgi:hypothetical protein